MSANVGAGVDSGVRFPDESQEYREARNQLLALELEERRLMERVAETRRQLPPGGVVPEDYAFEGARIGEEPRVLRLSELFAPGKDSLVLYGFMFPRHPGDDRVTLAEGKTAKLPREEQPCPSCTAFLDQLDGAAPHVLENLNFAVVAKSPIDRVLMFARERGWRHLLLLSAANNTFKHDYHAEAEDGSQVPLMNVFRRDGSEIRHFWASELFFADSDPGQDPRHNGTLEPLWTLFDLTPEGRPQGWHEQLRYD
jgi:predicted dithiol-disulfide oxidoreductase (DUF899 family)